MSVILFRDDPLLNSIASAAIRKFESAETQDLANAFWAYSRLHCMHCRVFDWSTRKLMKTTSQASPQDLSNTVWALSRIGWFRESSLGTIVQVYLNGLSEFIVQNLSNSAWAFSVF